MTPKEFADKLREVLPAEEFGKVCQLAKAGRMGFGENPNDWGSKDGKG